MLLNLVPYGSLACAAIAAYFVTLGAPVILKTKCDTPALSPIMKAHTAAISNRRRNWIAVIMAKPMKRNIRRR